MEAALVALVGLALLSRKSEPAAPPPPTPAPTTPDVAARVREATTEAAKLAEAVRKLYESFK